MWDGNLSRKSTLSRFHRIHYHPPPFSRFSRHSVREIVNKQIIVNDHNRHINNFYFWISQDAKTTNQHVFRLFMLTTCGVTTVNILINNGILFIDALPIDNHRHTHNHLSSLIVKMLTFTNHTVNKWIKSLVSND